MTNIRIAKLDDKERISAVLAASWKTAYRGMVGDDYLDALKYDHWVEFLTSGINGKYIISMVLEEGYTIIGAAILGESDIEDEIRLISFYLAPDRFGQGYGRMFYREIEEEVRQRGYTKCVLDVLEANEKAIRFYRANGFVDAQKKTTAALGSRQYTCLVMEKSL